jgi:hypothetical protein
MPALIAPALRQNQRSDDIKPLCPRHYVMMIFPAQKYGGTSVDTSETTGDHHWACPVHGFPQNYAPSLGYFAIEKSLDYWHVTGSSSLRIIRNTIQVICAHESDNVMFLETCEAEGKIQNFRCPQSDCKKTMRIPADGSPVCWLVEGFWAVTARQVAAILKRR